MSAPNVSHRVARRTGCRPMTIVYWCGHSSRRVSSHVHSTTGWDVQYASGLPVASGDRPKNATTYSWSFHTDGWFSRPYDSPPWTHSRTSAISPRRSGRSGNSLSRSMSKSSDQNRSGIGHRLSDQAEDLRAMVVVSAEVLVAVPVEHQRLAEQPVRRGRVFGQQPKIRALHVDDRVAEPPTRLATPAVR